MVTQNRLLLQKMQENAPKMAQTLHLKSGNGSLRIYPLCVTTLGCLCGTLVGKTELKCKYLNTKEHSPSSRWETLEFRGP